MASSTDVDFSKIFQQEGSITGVVSAPGDHDHLYLLEQQGQILQFNRRTGQIENILLDMTPEITRVYHEKPMMSKFPDERGLLSLAFIRNSTRMEVCSKVFFSLCSRK